MNKQFKAGLCIKGSGSDSDYPSKRPPPNLFLLNSHPHVKPSILILKFIQVLQRFPLFKLVQIPMQVLS